MTHRLTTNYAKNYCNRTLIVKVIVENVVTCFFGTRCTYFLFIYLFKTFSINRHDITDTIMSNNTIKTIQ